MKEIKIYPEKLRIFTGRWIEIIVANIVALEADVDYTFIYMNNGITVHRAYGRLCTFNEKLSPASFFRVERSWIGNIDYFGWLDLADARRIMTFQVKVKMLPGKLSQLQKCFTARMLEAESLLMNGMTSVEELTVAHHRLYIITLKLKVSPEVHMEFRGQTEGRDGVLAARYGMLICFV